MVNWKRHKTAITLIAFQLLILSGYFFFGKYNEEADAASDFNNPLLKHKNENEDMNYYYPMFQDIHIMIFFGVGFLLAFMRKYAYGSTGFNLLIASIAAELSILVHGFVYGLHDGKILVSLHSLIAADVAAAVVVVSWGAVVGRTSPLQLLVMSCLEIACYVVNEYVSLEIFQVTDAGGSSLVHVFAAFFGAGVARGMYRKMAAETAAKAESRYHSDVFSIAGTIFLWCFWPSFNAGFLSGDQRHRAVINTCISLIAAVIVVFAVSGILDKKSKFSMVHICNSTLAGGVAAGSVASMNVQPWVCIFLGMLAGVISPVGYNFISVKMSHTLKTHDVGGILNLHGYPGILGAVAGAVAAFFADTDHYGYNLYSVFPAMTPEDGSEEYANLTRLFEDAAVTPPPPGEGRDAMYQSLYQTASLLTTLAIGGVGGLITGLIMSLSIWEEPADSELYEDEPYWLLPEEDYHGYKHTETLEENAKYIKQHDDIDSTTRI